MSRLRNKANIVIRIIYGYIARSCARMKCFVESRLNAAEFSYGSSYSSSESEERIAHLWFRSVEEHGIEDPMLKVMVHPWKVAEGKLKPLSHCCVIVAADDCWHWMLHRCRCWFKNF